MTSPNDIPERYFGRARIVAGLALIGVAVFLCIWDAFHTDYNVEPGILGFLLGFAAPFLGVPGIGKIVERMLK